MVNMKSTANRNKTALVLPGGGARAAFQVGVLTAIAELLPRGTVNPFGIISGTSAGAINSVVLAAKARRFRVAIAELERVWGNFRCHHVYRTDNLAMLKSSLRWLGAFVTGGTLVRMPRSLLDNSPLRELGNHEEWSRTRRAGVRSRLNLDHLMASIAVPMIFPPVHIGSEYFGDGAMRQATPLAPAVHLGADRILVIGVRNEIADGTGDLEAPTPYPSFAEIAGYTLDTLFMDGLYSDLERLNSINQLIDTVPAEHRGPKLSRMRPIDTMVIVPSEDLRLLAHKHREALPAALRTLLWGISGRGRGEGRLLSYLMFEQSYTRELIELGYRDAMRVRNQLQDFISGNEVPRLFAPHWVEKDLDILHA
jgi:NTE family protein